MKLGVKEYTLLRHALHIAIESESALIDAHRVQFQADPLKPKVVPLEYKTVVTGLQENIEGWRRLLRRLP